MTSQSFDGRGRGPRPGLPEGAGDHAAFMIVDHNGTVARVTGWEKVFGDAAPERVAPAGDGDSLQTAMAEAIREASTTGGLARRVARLEGPSGPMIVLAASLAGGGGAGTAVIIQSHHARPPHDPAESEVPDEGKTIRKLEHDMRSPLTSISGAAELLESGRLGPLTAQQIRCLDVVQKGIDGMLQMLQKAAAPYRQAAPLRNVAFLPVSDEGGGRDPQ